MFDHVTVRVSDRDASEELFSVLLAELGVDGPQRYGPYSGWGDFMLTQAEDPGRITTGLHVGFAAPDREAIDRFWQAGIDSGLTSDGEPGTRARYGDDYYGAFLLDAEGNSIEAAQHENTRPGTIDHLWIGVEDADRSAAFYRAVSDHAGLREGMTANGMRQFRGESASFMLVADGRPITRNLHLAFPAPDRAAVDSFHAAAIEKGYDDNGEPGARPQYHPAYYGAFVLDPDGSNVESVCHAGA